MEVAERWQMISRAKKLVNERSRELIVALQFELADMVREGSLQVAVVLLLHNLVWIGAFGHDPLSGHYHEVLQPRIGIKTTYRCRI